MHGLAQYVKERGAISIADYMRLALMHPEYGYYQTGRAIGAAGDFITSPEISQIFGEMLGIWAADIWLRSGAPDAALVELGPGRGTLMKDALRATKHVKDFHKKIDVHLVEMSVGMRAAQKEMLADANVKIHWHETIETLPEQPIFVIANEFFDALPIRQFERSGEHWLERMVAWNEAQGRLVFTRADAPAAIRADADIVETCEEGEAVMRALAAHTGRHGGAILAIDYGYEGGSRADTLQAMRRHAYSDMLEHPGESDITAHVDFDALAKVAREEGLDAMRVMPQGEFLLRMGAEMRAQALCGALDDTQKHAIIGGLIRLVSPEQMGTLFKVLVCHHSSVRGV